VFFSFTGFPAWEGRGERLSSRNKMSQSVDGVAFVFVPSFAKSMKHSQKEKENNNNNNRRVTCASK